MIKTCKSCGEQFTTPYAPGAICPSCKNRICPVCGTQFAIHSLTRSKKYCCPACYHKAKVQLGQRPPLQPTKEKTPIPCPQCGKITQRLPYEVKYNTRFCNKACYLAYRKAQRVNGRSHSYFYMSADWINLRRRIKHRDKHTCQICFRMFAPQSRSLTIHHKTPRETFPGISDTIHILADDPTNLVALCNSCHQKLHMGSANIPVVSSEKGKLLPC